MSLESAVVAGAVRRHHTHPATAMVGLFLAVQVPLSEVRNSLREGDSSVQFSSSVVSDSLMTKHHAVDLQTFFTKS